jgi:hypothetical protein
MHAVTGSRSSTTQHGCTRGCRAHGRSCPSSAASCSRTPRSNGYGG